MKNKRDRKLGFILLTIVFTLTMFAGTAFAADPSTEVEVTGNYNLTSSNMILNASDTARIYSNGNS